MCIINLTSVERVVEVEKYLLWNVDGEYSHIAGDDSKENSFIFIYSHTG